MLNNYYKAGLPSEPSRLAEPTNAAPVCGALWAVETRATFSLLVLRCWHRALRFKHSYLREHDGIHRLVPRHTPMTDEETTSLYWHDFSAARGHPEALEYSRTWVISFALPPVNHKAVINFKVITKSLLSPYCGVVLIITNDYTIALMIMA